MATARSTRNDAAPPPLPFREWRARQSHCACRPEHPRADQVCRAPATRSRHRNYSYAYAFCRRTRRELAHILHQGLHIFDWSLGKDAVSQIKNMSRTPASLLEYVLRALAYLLLIRKERRRIKIALHRACIMQRSPAIIQADAPVQSDHLRTRLLHLRQQRRGVGPKINDRYT